MNLMAEYTKTKIGKLIQKRFQQLYNNSLFTKNISQFFK